MIRNKMTQKDKIMLKLALITNFIMLYLAWSVVSNHFKF